MYDDTVGSEYANMNYALSYLSKCTRVSDARMNQLRTRLLNTLQYHYHYNNVSHCMYYSLTLSPPDQTGQRGLWLLVQRRTNLNLRDLKLAHLSQV